MKFALLGTAVLCLGALPARADVPAGNGNANIPEPGTLNYIQGSANLAGKQLNNQNAGKIEMNKGQILHTQDGKAEVLLTPGVFLREDDHSSVKMISPNLTNTKVALEQGEIGIEVDEIHPQNDLQIVDNGVTTQLLKKGFYEFIASQPKVLVFSGEARVETGDGTYQKVKKHHEMALVASAQARPRRFNGNDAQDNLYNWSKLRSQYLAEANQRYAHKYGWGRWGGYPGWYWNPWALDWDWAWGPGWGPGWGFGWGWNPWWGPAFGYGGGFTVPLYHRHFDYDDHPGFRGRRGDHDGGDHGGRGRFNPSLRGVGGFLRSVPGGGQAPHRGGGGH